MQKQVSDPETLFAEILQDLPPEMEKLAREFKAFARARKIKSVAELMRLVLLYAGLDHSAREIAANVVLVNPEIKSLSEQSVIERLQACLPWLQALVPSLIERQPLPELPSGLSVRVLDASDITAPGQKKVSWRIHLMMDLVAWQLIAVQLTDWQTGETLINFDFQRGEVVLADRGYSHRKGLAHLIDQGARPVVRYNPKQIPVATRDGEPLDVAAALRDCAPGETRTLEAQFTAPNEKTYSVYIHAYRLQGAAAEAGRRRCQRGAQKAGQRKWRKYTPSQDTLLLAEFVLVLTTIEPAVLSAETVLALYRCRWQVELVFKHYKSLLSMDEVRARAGSVLGEVWLQGKLVYACLIARRAGRRCGADSRESGRRAVRDLVACLEVDQTGTDALDHAGAMLGLARLARGADGTGGTQTQTQTANAAVGSRHLVASACVRNRQYFERGGINA